MAVMSTMMRMTVINVMREEEEKEEEEGSSSGFTLAFQCALVLSSARDYAECGVFAPS